jgi:hypothetical protein
MGDEDGYKDFGGAGVSAFEQATGPFLYNAAQRSARFKVERRHCNQLGLCHGYGSAGPACCCAMAATLHSAAPYFSACVRWADDVLPPIVSGARC